jgi:hypothetical protein
MYLILIVILILFCYEYSWLYFLFLFIFIFLLLRITGRIKAVIFCLHIRFNTFDNRHLLRYIIVWAISRRRYILVYIYMTSWRMKSISLTIILNLLWLYIIICFLLLVKIWRLRFYIWNSWNPWFIILIHSLNLRCKFLSQIFSWIIFLITWYFDRITLWNFGNHAIFFWLIDRWISSYIIWNLWIEMIMVCLIFIIKHRLFIIQIIIV